jgi:hypothetical protein
MYYDFVLIICRLREKNLRLLLRYCRFILFKITQWLKSCRFWPRAGRRVQVSPTKGFLLGMKADVSSLTENPDRGGVCYRGVQHHLQRFLPNGAPYTRGTLSQGFAKPKYDGNVLDRNRSFNWPRRARMMSELWVSYGQFQANFLGIFGEVAWFGGCHCRAGGIRSNYTHWPGEGQQGLIVHVEMLAHPRVIAMLLKHVVFARSTAWRQMGFPGHGRRRQRRTVSEKRTLAPPAVERMPATRGGGRPRRIRMLST